MANQVTWVTAADGTLCAVELVDTGLKDAQNNPIYRIGASASVTVGAVGINGPVSISGTSSVTQVAATMPLPTVMQSGVHANATGTSLSVVGMAVAMIQITSAVAMSGGTAVSFYGSEDGINYYPILAHQLGLAGNLVSSTSTDGIYRIAVAGLAFIQARIGSYSAGTITVTGYTTPTAAHPTSVSVQGYSVVPPVTPALTTGTNYATGDYVGTSGAPMEFTNVARYAGGTFYLIGAEFIDIAKQSVNGELWLFDQTVTPPADSAAWTLSAADMSHLICIIPFSTWYLTASYGVSLGHPDFVGPFKCAAGGTSVFGCYVTRGSPTYATGNLTFKLSSAQD
jgi:hypothetical protein